MQVARAFQPEICPEGTSRGGGTTNGHEYEACSCSCSCSCSTTRPRQQPAFSFASSREKNRRQCPRSPLSIKCSSGFPARDLPSATGCLLIAAAGSGACRPWASREDAKTRRKRRGDVEPRMGSNECSSGFPARDLPSAIGCLLIAAAGSGACRPWASREDAKGKAEVAVWCSSRVSGKCLTARAHAARAV